MDRIREIAGAPAPVRRVGRRTIASNRVWDVHLDHIVDDRGVEVPDFLVLGVRGHADGGIGGVSVLPHRADGRVLLTRVYRHAVAQWSWECPRGVRDPGEDVALAARRELAEEAGVACGEGDLIALGHVYLEPSTITAATALFAARDCTPLDDAPPDDDLGRGESAWIDFKEVLAMADSGAITDGFSLLAIYRAARAGL